MADTSPKSQHTPPTDLSEEELDDFLAGAGTVSRDALPNPELILGDAMPVPELNGPAPLAKTVSEAPQKGTGDPPDANLQPVSPAADASSPPVPQESTTVQPPDPTPTTPASGSDILTPAAPPPPVKRKFSLRRLFGFKTQT